MTAQLRKVKRLFSALAAAAGMAMASMAAASPLQISIGSPTVGGFPAPYAQVTYDLVDSNTATFTFTAFTDYRFGSTQTVSLNFSGAVALVGAIAGDASPLGPGGCPYSAGGAGNVSGIGNMNFTVNTFDGANCSSTTISLTVDLVSGTWATTDAILAANNLGNLAGADVFAGCSGEAPTMVCVARGFSGGDTALPSNRIPEPQTLALLGLGSLGLVLSRRRRVR